MDRQLLTTPAPSDMPIREFYLRSLDVLDRAEVPYVVGGGYAMVYYTGIARQTKDLDLFLRPGDRDRALNALAAAGYRTEITWPHFLVKAVYEHGFVDILYNSGNGLSPVDDAWFTHAVSGEILGRPVPICPVEEMIWTKAFVQDRDRFDGADVAHLILARGEQMDWDRLVCRFQTHERVLLAHLLLFGYIYPSERHLVPNAVLDRLMKAASSEPDVDDRVCRGTFLAQRGYLPDVRERGYIDPRLKPEGPLTPEDIAKLTAA